MTEFIDVPKSSTAKDVVLAYSVYIPSKTTHNYTIELKYNNSDEVDQSDDMLSTLSGNIYIGVGTVPPTLAEAILRDNPTVSERTDFSVTNVANTTETIYKTNKTEDGSTVYYYSGNTTNNWVKFGKYNSNGPVIGFNSSTGGYAKEYETLEECNSASSYNYNCHYLYQTGDDIYWRIIRTNEDGSVRLLYAGTSHDTTSGYIGVSYYNTLNSDSRYVGYMFGENTSLEDNRTNATSSTIKGVIDTWYQNNLLTSYDKYISKSAIYCNDRRIGDGTWVSTGTTFYYGTYTRLYANKVPTYKCGGNTTGGLFESTQSVSDKFSVSTEYGGNGKLIYPIALMTADEIVFAGTNGSSLSSPYAWYVLNSAGENITNSNWWTMSPMRWWTNTGVIFNGNTVSEVYVYGSNIGGLSEIFVMASSSTVRPTISLSNCAKVIGTGTAADPYVIDESSSTC